MMETFIDNKMLLNLFSGPKRFLVFTILERIEHLTFFNEIKERLSDRIMTRS